MKVKFIGLLVALVLCLGLALPASAQGMPFGSLAVALDVVYVDIDNDNFEVVCNFSRSRANTGFNFTGYKGKVDTGNAGARTETGNVINSNYTAGAVTDTSLGPIAMNYGYGYEDEGDFDLFGGCGLMCWLFMHDPIAVAADIKYVKVNNVNFGFVFNDSLAWANTGWNFAFNKARINTGNASASTTTSTTLNTNTTYVEINDLGMVGPVAVNADFGYGAPGVECFRFGSLALALDVNAVSVSNNNFGLVSNFSFAGANTGMNYAGGKSRVNTGNARASTATSSTVNTNTTGVVITDTSSGPIAANAEMSPCGGADYCVGAVGPVAANVNTNGGVAVAADVNYVGVNNNNTALVDNTSVAWANSGRNNTGGGSTVTTGNASSSTTTANTVNTNTTSVAINDAGGVGPVAVNEETEGEAVAVAVEADVVEVENENTAVVSNESVASANTGQNNTGGGQAECDGSGSGSVNTGDASASTTTTNTVNTNTTTFVVNN